MDSLRVAVSGTGFMGREVLAAVSREPDLEPVGVIEKFAREDFHSLPASGELLPLSSDPEALIQRCRPDVIVDFTNAEWTPQMAKVALEHEVRLVIGTTGLSEAFFRELEALCASRGVGAVVAPNFAIGAVLMIHLAKIAARYFDFAEITEAHQEKKVDAPSGTAMALARAMAAGRGQAFEHTLPEKEALPHGRGATHEGIAIHSQRLPGFVAHHEAVFGGLGQTLRIRHDSTGRESFIPGVLLAVREVMQRRELVIGLENLVGL